jgi:hypothetical protein
LNELITSLLNTEVSLSSSSNGTTSNFTEMHRYGG